MKDHTASQHAQVVEGIVSVLVNAVLFAVKFWVGIATGSVALMADAWHTMSDSLTSIFVVIAAKLASKKADKEHPFGHGRWELIASLLIAFILGMIGYEFASSSIARFQSREYVTFGTLALAVTAVSIVIKELLAQYGFYLGRKHNNPVITADGWHSRTDALSSVVVLVGIVVTRFVTGLWWIDSVLGMFGALAIFYAAYKVMAEAVSRILGEAPDKDFITEIEAEIKRMSDKNIHPHHFHLHNYITHKELTLHILLDRDTSIYTGHSIATDIETMIEKKFCMIATVHVEPMDYSHNTMKRE